MEQLPLLPRQQHGIQEREVGNLGDRREEGREGEEKGEMCGRVHGRMGEGEEIMTEPKSRVCMCVRVCVYIM